jgi:hypothetical protein
VWAERLQDYDSAALARCPLTVDRYSAGVAQLLWVTGPLQCRVTRQPGATLRMRATWQLDKTWQLPYRWRHHLPPLGSWTLCSRSNYPGATCRALSHSVTVMTLSYKWPNRRKNPRTQVHLGKPRLEQYNSLPGGRRVLRSGGPNHVNHCVHRVYP